MKYTLIAVLAGFLSLVPFTSFAQTPQPVLNAFKAFESAPAKTNFSSTLSMEFLDEELRMDMKGTTYTDTAGNMEGTLSAKTNMAGEKGPAFGMQFKYFGSDNAFYVYFPKLPKDVDDLKNLKAKTWYKGTVDASDIPNLTGQSQLGQQNFVEAQATYPAFTFTEKGSSKKEHKYAFVLNRAQFGNFMGEMARLSGGTMTAQESALVAGVINSLKGTLVINKKTSLPSAVTQRVTSMGGAMTLDMTAKYTYSGAGFVKRPTSAVTDESIIKGIFPGM